MKLSILFSSKLIVVHNIVCHGWRNPIRVAHARNPKTFAFSVGHWCVALRTVSKLSAPGHKKGPKTVPWQSSPAYSFINSFFLFIPLCGRAFGGLPSIKGIYQIQEFSARGNGHRRGLLHVPCGGCVISGRKCSLLSPGVADPDGEPRKCWIWSLKLLMPKMWQMRNFVAFLEVMDDRW